jgi:imidazolonepropionase-like amidohydrolase
MLGKGLRDNVRMISVDQQMAIRCGRLVDGTGRRVRTNVTILIEQGRIAQIIDGQIADEKGLIDASGYTVLPGLIDAHLHLNGETSFDAYRRYLTPTDGVKLIKSAIDAQDLLGRGFTSIRDVGTGFGLEVKRAVTSGLIPGPRILTSVHGMSQTAGHGDWHALPYEYLVKRRPRAYFADGPEACRLAVRQVVREGADLVKIFLASGGITNTPEDLRVIPNYTPEEVRAFVDEARRLGVKVAAHCVGHASIELAVNARVDTIEHCMMERPDRELLSRVAAAGIIVVPTMAIFHWVATEGQRYGVFAQGVEAACARLKIHQETVALAHHVGVTVAVGTDNNGLMGDGNNAVEFELLTKSGLSTMDAIVAGTRNGARALGIDRDTGTVEVGRRPDLIVLRDDPLEDITVLQKPETIVHVLRGPLS